MKKSLIIAAIIAVGIALFYLFVYEKPGPMEELGNTLDEGIDKIQHGDETTLEKAGRKTQEAIDDAAKGLGK